MRIFNATDKIETLKLKIFLWKSHVEESDITWPTSRIKNLSSQKQMKQMKAVFSAQPHKLNFLSSLSVVGPETWNGLPTTLHHAPVGHFIKVKSQKYFIPTRPQYSMHKSETSTDRKSTRL